MIPIVKNQFVRFGDTHQIFFRIRERQFNSSTNQWEPGPYRDLTGWAFKAQVRTDLDTPAVLYEYTVTLGNQADLTVGRGSVFLEAEAATTKALRNLNPVPTEGVYDVEATTPQGDVFTYIEGTITFKKDVTRV